jgi:hypothetical protein
MWQELRKSAPEARAGKEGIPPQRTRRKREKEIYRDKGIFKDKNIFYLFRLSSIFTYSVYQAATFTESP